MTAMSVLAPILIRGRRTGPTRYRPPRIGIYSTLGLTPGTKRQLGPKLAEARAQLRLQLVMFRLSRELGVGPFSRRTNTMKRLASHFTRGLVIAAACALLGTTTVGCGDD